MARIRTIKPEFTQSEDLSRVPAETHLFAAGLLCYADDEGYFNANPALAAAAIFPLRELSGKIPEMFGELEKAGFLRFGRSADGRRYGHILNFAKHQRISHLTPSKIRKLGIVWEDSGEFPENSGGLREGSALKGTGNREQGTGKGREGNGETEGKGDLPLPHADARGDSNPPVHDETSLRSAWWRFYDALKQQLCDAPLGHPNFTDVQRGETDWGACFADWTLVEASQTTAGVTLHTTSRRPSVTEAGLLKYSKRIAKLSSEAFGQPASVLVRESPP